MPSPPAMIRQAATLVALVGCALAIGPARSASAAGCHVDDRPAFGLSAEAGSPVGLPDGGAAVASSGPIRVERRCPSDATGRTSPGPVVVDGQAMAATEAMIPPPTSGFLRVDRREARPTMSPPRIDRPPRAR